MLEVQVEATHGSILFDLLSADARREMDSRADVRYPFVRPVVIHAGDERHLGLTREISRSGVGLTHKAALEPGSSCHLNVVLEDGQVARIPISVRWCRQVDSEWYISGAMFLVESPPAARPPSPNQP